MASGLTTPSATGVPSTATASFLARKLALVRRREIFLTSRRPARRGTRKNAGDSRRSPRVTPASRRAVATARSGRYCHGDVASEPCWYFGYGSNMNRGIFEGRRAMRPLATRWGWLADKMVQLPGAPVRSKQEKIAFLQSRVQPFATAKAADVSAQAA